jgi:hypothetical protein
VGEPDGDERDADAAAGDDEREVHGIGGLNNFPAGGGNDEGGAGRLGEGSEKIGTHTGNVSDVVTDVVSDGTGVLGRVFGEALGDLSSEISTDISGLGVDTTTDTSEKSNSGATETVSGDELEKFADGFLVLCLGALAVDDGGLVAEDEDLEDEEGEADEHEAEDLSTNEGDLEALDLILAARGGNLVVAEGSDLHADEAGNHGGSGSDNEGESSEGEPGVGIPGLVNGTDEENGEENAEDSQVGVFFGKEGIGTL